LFFWGGEGGGMALEGTHALCSTLCSCGRRAAVDGCGPAGAAQQRGGGGERQPAVGRLCHRGKHIALGECLAQCAGCAAKHPHLRRRGCRRGRPSGTSPYRRPSCAPPCAPASGCAARLWNLLGSCVDAAAWQPLHGWLSTLQRVASGAACSHPPAWCASLLQPSYPQYGQWLDVYLIRLGPPLPLPVAGLLGSTYRP
jgi:hypothetical protein